jgi:hypothetical protein
MIGGRKLFLKLYLKIKNKKLGLAYIEKNESGTK